MEIHTHENRCKECWDIITNPMCPGCISKGVEQWALIWMPEIVPYLDFGLGEGAGTKCVLCGREMSMCAFCYSKEIYEMVVSAIPELGEEFLQHFNFGLREYLT